MTQTDDGSILFPSVTICKSEMFTNVNYNERGLLARLKSGEVSSENARSWFEQRTSTLPGLLLRIELSVQMANKELQKRLYLIAQTRELNDIKLILFLGRNRRGRASK